MLKGPVGCLIKLLITLAIIVAIIAIAFITVIELTPNQLHIADISIGGTSLAELGLGDVKLIDIWKAFKSLSAPDESKIVTNAPTAADKTAANENAKGSDNISVDADGNADYSAILKEPATYDKEYLLEYKDTTLASIFQSIVKSAKNDAAANEDIKALADIGANFNELTISGKQSNGKASVRIVASVDLTGLKGEISKALPAAVSNIISIPDTVYLVSYQTIDADSEGKLVCTSQSIKINDQDNALSDAIFKVLSDKVEDKENSDKDTKTLVNEKIGDGFEYIISNLGKIGTASTDSDKVVTGEKSLGNQGIANGKITVITIVKE